MHVEDLKDNFAYFNRQTFFEFQRSFEWKNKLYASNFLKFSKKEVDDLTTVTFNQNIIIIFM